MHYNNKQSASSRIGIKKVDEELIDQIINAEARWKFFGIDPECGSW